MKLLPKIIPNPSSSLPLLWEFPGGRVEENETDQQALSRELHEEMEIEVEVSEASVAVTHEYSAYIINFCVYRCTLVTPEENIKKIGRDLNFELPSTSDLTTLQQNKQIFFHYYCPLFYKITYYVIPKLFNFFIL